LFYYRCSFLKLTCLFCGHSW